MTEELEKLQDICFKKAHIMMNMGLSQGMDVFDLTELLIKIELEKQEKQRLEDEKIDFNDEILEIEDVGELETVDISVTGNQLFYCNNILTKNSMGITHTADAIFGIVTSEALDELGQIMIKQLKNRWGDLGYYRRFLVGIDRSKMKIYELEENAQANINSDSSGSFGGNNKKQDGNSDAFDKTDIGTRLGSKRKSKVFGDVQLT